MLAELVEDTDYSHYLIVSDDGVVSPRALGAVCVLLDHHPVVTGWSNLDCIEAKVNLQRTPLPREIPDGLDVWDLYHFAEVLGHPDEAIPTYFGGMCLTGMSRSMWQRFPFGCYGTPGGGSDYHLSWRLQQASVPIVAARDGFVFHLKERWGQFDAQPDRQCLIGEAHRAVRIECA